MTDSPDYTPPKVWTWNKGSGGRFANINRPVAGATHEKALPVGKHPLQLYSLATPNGQKVSILLEELLEEEFDEVFIFRDNSVVWRGDHFLTAGQIERLRSRGMNSFGSCSFDEPITDLQGLGIL